MGGKGYSRVQGNGRQDHGVIGQNQKGTPNGDDPQDYEIPTPKANIVQNM